MLTLAAVVFAVALPARGQDCLCSIPASPTNPVFGPYSTRRYVPPAELGAGEADATSAAGVLGQAPAADVGPGAETTPPSTTKEKGAGSGVPAAAEPARPPLSVTLYAGPLVTFGSDAKPGSAPFAQLRTVTQLKKKGNAPEFVTRTEFTAAPGADFDLANPETFRAVNFDGGLAWGPATWNMKLYATCGVIARAFESDGLEPAAQRRCGAGVLIESSEKSHLSAVYGRDERSPSRRGLQVEAAIELPQGLAIVGSLVAHGRSVTVTIAACKAWGGGK